jgi:hypothetical protein
MELIYICIPNLSLIRNCHDMRSYINFIGFVLLVSFIIAGCKKTVENNPPVITSVTVSPKTVTPGSSTQVVVKATDNDGDLIVYSYVPSGGYILGTGSSVNWLAPDSVGDYTLIIKASDGSGDYSIDSISLAVREFVTPTQLKGTATFSVGVEGDLSNSRVSLYASLADREAGMPQKSIVTGSGSFSILNFTMDSITPGDYYIDIWKDNDNSLTHSNGDFLGWYGSGNLLNPQLTKQHFAEGETVTITMQMFIY